MVMVSKSLYKGSVELDDVVKMLNSERCCMLSEGFSMLAYGTFRVMLAGVGGGSFLSLSRLRWGFFDV
jgi:hypothetical protein